MFEVPETVVQLHCGHNAHLECVTGQCLQVVEGAPCCAVCGGPFLATKSFNCHCDGTAVEGSGEAPTPGTASGTQMPMSASFIAGSPWVPAPGCEQPTGVYYGKAELQNGRPAALIDPGAYTSAAGETAINQIAATAHKKGYSATPWTRH